jgi:hypothetical protein
MISLIDRGLLLTKKLLNQRFLVVKLKSSIRKFYGHRHDLVKLIIPYVQIYNPFSSSMLSMYHWGQAVLEWVRNRDMNHFF